MAIGIPPWLSIDPVAPVGRFLEGYRSGLQAGEAQASQALRMQQMALAAQEAAQMAQLRQQQQELDAAQFNARLRLDEQRAQREAQEAALQMEGQQGLQKDLAAGIPLQQAFVKWAPKLLYRHPERLPQAIESMTPQPPPVFGTTPQGIPFAQNQRTGSLTFPPAGLMRQGFEPQVQTFGGVRAIETSPGQWRPVREMSEGALTQVQRAELQSLNRREANLYRQLGGLTEEEAAEDPALSKVLDQIADIEAERQAIFSGTQQPRAEAEAPAPTRQKLTVEQAREFLRQAGGDKAKARQLAKDAGFEF